MGHNAVEGAGARRTIDAEIEYTFRSSSWGGLGDGVTTGRQIAGDGALTQPLTLTP